MEAFAVLVVLGLLFVALVMPVVAAMRASRALSLARELEQRLSRTEWQLEKLESERAKRSMKPPVMTEQESAKVVAKTVKSSEPEPESPLPPPESPTPVLAKAHEPEVPVSVPPVLAASSVSEPSAGAATAEPMTAGLPKARSLAAEINWEQFMGVKLFAWLGGLALFLAVAYFVKYSFEHNLIPPEVRVALGFLTGLGLLAGGVVMNQGRFRVTSHTLCGTGIVILYAVTFACRAVYRFPFFEQVPTFLLMVLITVTAFTLSVRMNALVVAVLGMLGGFLTPILLSTGQDNALALFTYVALLDLGLVAVAFHRQWTFLVALGALGTVAMQMGWAATHFQIEKVRVALAVHLLFDVLFVAVAWVWLRRERLDRWIEGAAAGAAFATLGFSTYLLSLQGLGDRPGILFAFVFGADMCLLGLASMRPALAPIQLIAGAVTFLQLMIWTSLRLDANLLRWGLGLYLLFAVLHAAYPLVIQRWRPGMTPVWWAHLAPPCALVLLMVPMFKEMELSFILWPVMMLIDGLAIAIAVMTFSVVAIGLALVLSVGVIFLWLVRMPLLASDVPEVLLVIGGCAVFFYVLGWWASKHIARKEDEAASKPGKGSASAGWLFGRAPLPVEVQAQIPALSAVLPFLLLIMAVLRIPLGTPSPIFGLALLFVVLLLGLSRTLRLPILVAVALGSVLALEHVWFVRRMSETTEPLIALGWYVGFAVLFVAFPFTGKSSRLASVIPWATGALAGPLHFYLVHRWVKHFYGGAMEGVMGLLPLGFAGPMLACLVVVIRQFPSDHPGRNSVLAWFGGAALFFITLVFPIQFDRQWITIGWALEGVALCWLFHRVPHPGLRYVGVGLLVVAFVRLALNPAVLEYHPRSSTPLFNWYLYAYGLAIASLFGAAKLLAPPNHQLGSRDARPLLVTLGTILAFLLLNIQIADYFTDAGEATLTFRFLGGAGKSNFALDMSYSIAWGLFALVLMVVGLWRGVRAARVAGLALLGVTLSKLFLHDLAALKQLYRAGALFGVGIIAFVASYLYQRFQSTYEASDEKNKA